MYIVTFLDFSLTIFLLWFFVYYRSAFNLSSKNPAKILSYDSSGLTMKALQEANIHHNAQATWTEDVKQKDDIEDITNDKLFLLFRREMDGRMTHIGIYIWDDTIIEGKGADYGVVQISLKNGSWYNYWAVSRLE